MLFTWPEIEHGVFHLKTARKFLELLLLWNSASFYVASGKKVGYIWTDIRGALQACLAEP